MPHDDVTILRTAQEAYPAFERAVLEARNEVLIAMRVFDPATRLRSEAGRAIGATWADLIAHKLGQGVRFDITIADFDPVARPGMHRYSHECLRALRAVAPHGALEARCHMHPARVGWAQRVAFFPMARRKLAQECARLNALPADRRRAELADMPALRALLTGQDRLRPRRWPPVPLVPATHHQKLAVIDGAAQGQLYIGGLDLNERRYDDPDHRRASDQTWHDVQLLLRGPAVAAARAHLLAFRAETAGTTPPPPRPGLLRTVSAPARGALPRLSPATLVDELEQAHLRLIGAARRYLYIETQFLRDSSVSAALIEAAARPDLNVIMVLPAAPSDLAFEQSDSLDLRFGQQLQADRVDALRAAFGARLFLGSPAQCCAAENPRDPSALHGAPIIYVHAKVLVSDGTAALVSSANLNGRSMRWDTEAGVELGADDAQRLFAGAVAHWFPEIPPDDPTRAADWAALARHAADQAPARRRQLILPHRNSTARETGTPVPGMPEEMV